MSVGLIKSFHLNIYILEPPFSENIYLPENTDLWSPKLPTFVNELDISTGEIPRKFPAHKCVEFTEESNSSSDLVNKADKRLYKAKKSGRNRFILIDSEIVGE